MKEVNQQQVGALLSRQESGPIGKATAALLAVGLTTAEISKVLEEPSEKIQLLSDSEKVTEMVSALQIAMGMSLEERLNAMAKQALAVVAVSLASKDIKLASTQAQVVLDRVLGKPVQSVQQLLATKDLGSDESVKKRMAQIGERLAALEAKRQKLLKDSTVVDAELVPA